jgi:hypothetical protein
MNPAGKKRARTRARARRGGENKALIALGKSAKMLLQLADYEKDRWYDKDGVTIL